jgi:hypothetical protein
MNLIFIQKPGINLYQTFFDSETSRRILRFYRPVQLPYGVLVKGSSLAGMLSLAAELKWYIRRYVSLVIFEDEEGRHYSHELARAVYSRELENVDDWPYRKRLHIGKDGGTSWGAAEKSADQSVYEVLCTPVEPEPQNGSGEHGAE